MFIYVCKHNRHLYQNLRLTYTEGFICKVRTTKQEALRYHWFELRTKIKSQCCLSSTLCDKLFLSECRHFIVFGFSGMEIQRDLKDSATCLPRGKNINMLAVHVFNFSPNNCLILTTHGFNPLKIKVSCIEKKLVPILLARLSGMLLILTRACILVNIALRTSYLRSVHRWA